MKTLRVFEAFSGYGSQSLKLKDLDIKHKVVGTSEYDYNAIIAYSAVHENFANVNNVSHNDMKKYLIERNIGFDFKKNKSKIPRMKKNVLEKVYSATIGQKCYGDILLLNPKDLPDMDLFTYSFPCQDISVAGQGKGFDEDSETRSSLLWESRKIIKNKKPKFLMMENVKNIISKKHKPNFKKWMNWLESNGYNNYYKLINAKNCGIPQNRQRVFLISILKKYDNGNFHFEDDFNSGLTAIDFMDSVVDKKYYMSGEKTKKIIDIYIKSMQKINDVNSKGIVIDKSIKNTKVINIANCITAREDRGISNRASEGTAVIERRSSLKIIGNVNPSGRGMNGNVYNSRNDAPTITTNKGEGIKMIVPKEANNKLNMIGLLNIKGNENIRRVYDPKGICLTISTCQGGHREPKFIIYDDYNSNVRKDQNTIGAITGNIGNISPRNSFKLIEKKIIQNNHGYNKGGVHNLAPTLTSSCYHENNFLLEAHKSEKYIVRKLTPREAFRLMGLNESEIDKIQSAGISNSQQYKLAGNSIVKQMMAFLKNLPYDNL